MTTTADMKSLHKKLTTELNTLASMVLYQMSKCPHPTEQQLASQLLSHAVPKWPDLDTSSLSATIRPSFQRIETILATLSQIELNIYGLCADCERQIEAERLSKDPTTQRCSYCAEKQLSDL